jgi:hypothetical protein
MTRGLPDRSGRPLDTVSAPGGSAVCFVAGGLRVLLEAEPGDLFVTVDIEQTPKTVDEPHLKSHVVLVSGCAPYMREYFVPHEREQ